MLKKQRDRIKNMKYNPETDGPKALGIVIGFILGTAAAGYGVYLLMVELTAKFGGVL